MDHSFSIELLLQLSSPQEQEIQVSHGAKPARFQDPLELPFLAAFWKVLLLVHMCTANCYRAFGVRWFLLYPWSTRSQGLNPILANM